jgi:predicted metal-dependent phosphoesterase TrpH
VNSLFPTDVTITDHVTVAMVREANGDLSAYRLQLEQQRTDEPRIGELERKIDALNQLIALEHKTNLRFGYDLQNERCYLKPKA